MNLRWLVIPFISLAMVILIIVLNNYLQNKTDQEMKAIYDREAQQTKILIEKDKKNLCNSYHRWTELAHDHVDKMDKYCE